MGTKSRTVHMDIARGLAVILVVIGHMRTLMPSYVFYWINSFHMPFFFFISGYFYQGINSGTEFKNYGYKKLKTILVPYLAYSILFAGINAISWGGTAYFIDCMKGMLLFDGGYYMLWFFPSLFLVEIIYAFIDLNIKNGKYIHTAIILLVILGFILHRFGINYFKVGTAFWIIGIFHLGSVCKKKIPSIVNTLSIRVLGIVSIVNLSCFIAIYLLTGKCLELVFNDHVDIVFNYLIAVSGILGLIQLSLLIEKHKISRALGYIGKNSVYFYPLTGFIPDLAKIVINESNIIKIASRIFSFVFTTGLIQIKSMLKKKG